MNGNKSVFSDTLLLKPGLNPRDYMELIKPHLCFYVALSGILGHVAASGRFVSTSLLVGAVICVLSFGAAALNNVQDRAFDRQFSRTCNRVLPSGRLQVLHAVLLSGILIAAGLWGLLILFGIKTFAWGASALVCYNLIYTPLKKISILAIIPGSFCGMLVPVIGWSATGRSVHHHTIWIIMAVFALWQMAHYFLILLKHEKTWFAKGTKKLSFPNFFSRFSNREIRVQALVWSSLYILAILLYMVKAVEVQSVSYLLHFCNAFISLGLIVSILIQKKVHAGAAFVSINLSILIFMGTNICDKFL